ncbi:hypothetical protein [Photobacterium leiognathi]|uniref:hypothetical protein n=1 Tax=Photobacterium leiognathi TaxID=553611 RepID=UPI0029828DF0|nr:hypothetical protein [Photobacterium leiognathi]
MNNTIIFCKNAKALRQLRKIVKSAVSLSEKKAALKTISKPTIGSLYWLNKAMHSQNVTEFDIAVNRAITITDTSLNQIRPFVSDAVIFGQALLTNE